MVELIVSVAEIIETIGYPLTILIFVAMVLLILGMLYLQISLETHLRHSSIRSFFRYGTYLVIAENENTKKRQDFFVQALNKENALEKVAKDLENVQQYKFNVNFQEK